MNEPKQPATPKKPMVPTTSTTTTTVQGDPKMSDTSDNFAKGLQEGLGLKQPQQPKYLKSFDDYYKKYGNGKELLKKWGLGGDDAEDFGDYVANYGDADINIALKNAFRNAGNDDKHILNNIKQHFGTPYKNSYWMKSENPNWSSTEQPEIKDNPLVHLNEDGELVTSNAIYTNPDIYYDEVMRDATAQRLLPIFKNAKKWFEDNYGYFDPEKDEYDRDKDKAFMDLYGDVFDKDEFVVDEEDEDESPRISPRKPTKSTLSKELAKKLGAMLLPPKDYK